MGVGKSILKAVITIGVFLFIQSYLENRYRYFIKNKSPIIWIVIAVVFAYAFYCTSRGYSFTGQIRFTFPFVKIGCQVR